MDIRTLRYLLAVVDTGSVSAAARAVRVAQPSLSRQLSQLERSLGLRLFDRRAGRLTLSSAGREFVPLARELVAHADATAAAAAALAAGRLDSITVAAPPTTMTDVIAPFLVELRPDDPFPSTVVGSPQGVYATLRSGSDLAVSTERPPAGLQSTTLARLPIWLYVPTGHEWAGRASVGLAELTPGGRVGDDLLLVLPADFKPRELLAAAAERADVDLGRLTETTSAEVAQALAASGRGVAVVSDDARFGLQGLRITEPDGQELALYLYAAWNPDHHAASVLAELAERIARFCIARYGPAARPTPARGRSEDAVRR